MKPTVPERAAILIIDVQTGLFSSDPPPFEAAGVIERINAVAAKARQAGVPVIFVQHDGGPEDNLVPHSQGWHFHPKLEVKPGELVVHKTTCDAFYQTTLEAELRSRGIQKLVLMGYATDFCIDTTLRNALSKDFSVTIVSDAHTTNDSPVLKADLIRQHHNYAWPNCISKHGVTVLSASEVSFPATAV